MRRIIIIIIIVIVVALAGWWAYNTYGTPSATSESTGTDTEQVVADLENVIWASGNLVPEQWAGLSPAVAGNIAAIHVQEGDMVEEGTLLVEASNDVLKSQVAVAAAAVGEAEAALAQLRAGATPPQLQGAAAEVEAAEAAVALAEAQLQQARDAVAASEAQVAIARAQYNELASHPTRSELVAAQREVDIAKAGVDQAQAAYNIVRGNPHIAALPESLALQQATAAYEAAQAALESVRQGATRQQLAVAQAQIDAAQRQVATAQAQIPAAEAGMKSAQAQQARAEANRSQLEMGATAEDVAVAEARVASAQANLAAAQAQLTQTQLVAPFAGQVGTIHARLGELATPGVPVLLLGDTGELWVETTDLRETDVTKVEVGMPVEVTFDALPGEEYGGTVVRIAPMSTVEQGSTNYTVIVKVDDLDPSLRWGMTAFVNIDTAP